MADFALTLSESTAYRNGEDAGNKFIGYQYNGGDVSCSLCFSFTVPTGKIVTGVKLTTTLRYYSGDTGYTRPVRILITDDPDRKYDVGASSEYDGEFSYTVSSQNTSATINVSGLYLNPGETYYLFIFPGSGYKNDGSSQNGQYQVFTYDNGGNELTSLVATETLSGLVYIDNGTSWEAYEVYIDNGTSWEQYIPYIDTGTGWDMCG